MSLEWDFHYRYYPKQRIIQLKPANDKTVHFSIAWANPKESIFKVDFDIINKFIIKYLEMHNWTLTFRPIKACENCTYGYFDENFENLILGLRDKYKLCCDKDLPICESSSHESLLELPEVNRLPIMSHISHSRSNDETFNSFMQQAKIGSVMTLKISIR